MWTSPKNDWQQGDAVMANDMNKIGENLRVLGAYNLKEEDVTTVTTATGTVNIDVGLPVGTKKLVRKLNSTQGTVNIFVQGSERITKSLRTAVQINNDGDFWLLEKVSLTRWDIVAGFSTVVASGGTGIQHANGQLINEGVLRLTTLNSGGSLPVPGFPIPFLNTGYSIGFNIRTFGTPYKMIAFAITAGSAQEHLQTFSGGEPGTGINVTYDYKAVGVWY